ncbi:hypothetical protein ACIRG8_17610 [Streptomyces sp. NPDC102359]|uniref:hypothetical protein n=1 Tax=unclassified Streptomyces TaxID=2593676 RepID=UPI0037FDDF0C
MLCRAIAAHEADVAEALVEAGADQDRELPDGTTPLVRAVDGGSPATVTAVLGREPRLRLPESERAALLARARRWYEEGAEAVLRQRTDAPGPVNSTTVILLGTEDFRVRLNATYGLLRRDDPRTEKAVARLGTAPPGHEDDHRVSVIRHWQGERDRSSGVPGEPPAS